MCKYPVASGGMVSNKGQKANCCGQSGKSRGKMKGPKAGGTDQTYCYLHGIIIQDYFLFMANVISF